MLDDPGKGRHYATRMQCILKACQDCGVLSHVETRSGQRIDDVTSSGEVRVTTQAEKYALVVSSRVLDRIMGMATQFAHALNVPSVTVERDGGIVYVRVPKSKAAGVTFDSAWRMAPVPSGALLLGMDDDGQQLVLTFGPATPHCAVVGMTGSGKTTLMRTMCLSALMSGARVALFDPLGKGLAPLSGHSQVWRGIWDTADKCVTGLSMLLAEHQRGRLFVFVDEAPLLMQNPKARALLTQISQSGRHAGLALILGAQSPSPSDLLNVPVRLVGKVANDQAAYIAAGTSGTGAKSLRGAGDFIAISQGAVVHFQAAAISATEMKAWTQRYPPRLAQPPAPKPARAVRVYHSKPPTPVERNPAGRPEEIPDEGAIRAILSFHRRTGKWPSSNWIREWTKGHYGAMYGRPKSARALDMAKERAR